MIINHQESRLSRNTDTQRLLPEYLLYCHSCGRKSGDGPDDVHPILDGKNRPRCPVCAKKHIFTIDDRKQGCSTAGAGLMHSCPLDSWWAAHQGTFACIPLDIITLADAEFEIQRAWALWDGDKKHREAKYHFYQWLEIVRPYFLTFKHRTKNDPWKRVELWICRYLDGKGKFQLNQSGS